MSTGNDTLLRQWLMLRLIPRYPRKVTATELTDFLRETYEVTKRTVERDLNTLSNYFPLVSDDREKPYGWSWSKEAANFDIPGMAPAEALTLMLARDHLKHIFPAPLLGQIAPYFRQAETTLNQAERLWSLAHWSEKIATVAPTQPLIPPHCDEDVMQAVHDGLLHERQLQITYHSRSTGQTNDHLIHPLGLVLRGAVSYIVCTFSDYSDVRMLALHRIKQAVVQETARKIPEGFSLKGLIAKGAFGFEEKGHIQLVARFEAPSADHLFETVLSHDQVISDVKDGWVTVTATVLDTQQLRWWLLGFGGKVEILKPKALRDEVIKTVQDMSNIYLTPD